MTADNGAADELDMTGRSQVLQKRLGLAALFIGQVINIRRVERQVPQFRQHGHIRPSLGRLLDMVPDLVEIGLPVAGDDRKLNE